jgi:hypothetical protein
MKKQLIIVGILFFICCQSPVAPDLTFTKLNEMSGKWEVITYYCVDNEETDYKQSGYTEYWEIKEDSVILYALNVQQNGKRINSCYHKLVWLKETDSIFRDGNGNSLYYGWSEKRKMNVIQYTAGAPGFGYQTNTFFIIEYIGNLPPSKYPNYCY